MRAESERRFEEADARFEAILDEMRTMRVESEQRFEAVDRRFDEVRGEIAGVRGEVAKVMLGVGALGGRMGRKLEDVIRQVIENFSGVGPLKAERFVLIDETGEFRHPGATTEGEPK